MATVVAPPSPAVVPVAFDPHAHEEHHQGIFRTYIWSHDHKMIAKQYLVTALFFLIVGGLLAMGVRYKIAFPNVPVYGLNWLLHCFIVTD